MSAQTILEIVLEIDLIESTNEMIKRVAALGEERNAVIMEGLRTSRFQFQWSHMARQHSIPEKDWPPYDEEITSIDIPEGTMVKTDETDVVVD